MLKNKIGWTSPSLKGYEQAMEVQLEEGIYLYETNIKFNCFSFLNIAHDFKKSIDWNFAEYGKLWTYNLNYFEFLLQKDFSKEEGLRLIRDFIIQFDSSKDGIEPFPISLRGMNWIKFLVKHDIGEIDISKNLYLQYQILFQKQEYHLMGNHLLENGFSLLFGAVFFNNKKFYKAAVKILGQELEEQILTDGAHFELSPMYHQHMLFRVLDSINLLKNNTHTEEKLFALLERKATMMISWLEKISFKNGNIPMLNDSAPNIAPSTHQLLEYAKRLGIKRENINLGESGFRKVEFDNYELILDVGKIGPDYIPGHAHSDTLQFVMNVRNQPFIVDTAISTYEKNGRRQKERATSSHNTVQLGEIEQSEVWGGFRVARRAYSKILREEKYILEASHTGYERLGVCHTRKFEWTSEEVLIVDEITNVEEWTKRAYLHFHPNINPSIENLTVYTDIGKIQFENVIHLEMVDYKFATGFNQLETAKKVIIYFNQSLRTRIIIR